MSCVLCLVSCVLRACFKWHVCHVCHVCLLSVACGMCHVDCRVCHAGCVCDEGQCDVACVGACGDNRITNASLNLICSIRGTPKDKALSQRECDLPFWKARMMLF